MLAVSFISIHQLWARAGAARWATAVASDPIRAVSLTWKAWPYWRICWPLCLNQPAFSSPRWPDLLLLPFSGYPLNEHLISNLSALNKTASLDLLLILPTSLPFLIIFPQDWLLTTHNIICYLYVHLIPWECKHCKGINFVLFVMGFTEFESRAWIEQSLTHFLTRWMNESIYKTWCCWALEIKIHIFASGFAIQTIFLAI